MNDKNKKIDEEIKKLRETLDELDDSNNFHAKTRTLKKIEELEKKKTKTKKRG